MKEAIYQTRELLRVYQRETALNQQSIEDRKAAQADTLAAMRDPLLIGERARWLLDGHYGYGEMLRAQRAITGRGNAQARLMQELALWEFNCPRRHTRAAWKELTSAEQLALSIALVHVIKGC